MTPTDAADPSLPVTIAVRARWDDCDGYGHVNNAAYLALMREAHDLAREALGTERETGRLIEVEIVYREPILPGQTIDIAVALVDDTPPGRRFHYLMSTDGRPRAELTATWAPDRASVPTELPVLARDAGGHPFQWPHVVRSHEVAPDGAVRPAVVLEWFEHAVFRSAARAGWDRSRMVAADFIALVIGHHLVLGVPAREGDELNITSRLVEARRVSGSWRHEVRLPDGTLVAADHDRGAFLDTAGRIRLAPDGLIEDLLRGEPDEPPRRTPRRSRGPDGSTHRGRTRR
jgi:acyl-CoA thioesterase FadM